MKFTPTAFCSKTTSKQLQNLSCLTILIALLWACPANAQRSFLGPDGGFEGPATIVNATTNTTPVATNWTKSTTAATIAAETTTVRSGSKSLKVTSATLTTSRVYSPSVPITASTTAWQVQYYRRSTNITNTVENQSASYRTTTEQLNASYTGVTAANTWEKVTYSPSSVTSATAAAAGVLVRQKGTGGDTYYDDFVLYESATIDVTAPSSAGIVTVSNMTGTTADVNWVAASGGVDGGGYLVVRYATNPNVDNDPNVNGVYGVGNTITNGTGSLVGTVCYVGTGTSFTDTGLSSGTYYYKVYTFDKAYNYASEAQGVGTTSLPTIAGFSPTTACLGSTLVITGTNFTGATSVTIGGVAATSFTVNSNTQITAIIGAASSGSVSVSVSGNTATLTGLTINAAPAAPTLTAGGATSFCVGGSVVLTASSGTSYLWSTGATTPSITVSTSGSYTAKVFNAGGCVSAASTPTVVTANPIPSAPTLGSNSAICEGNTLNLTASTVPVTGYTMNSNSGVSFVDISSSGTSIGTIANDSATTITMPSFTFNGTSYTTATVSNNGLIFLGTVSGIDTTINTALPNSTTLAGAPVLAPYWDDLTINSGAATIKTQTVGSVFIIQFTGQNHVNFAAGTITFQVQFNLTTGAIHYVYSDALFGSATYDYGASATVGLQTGGNSGLQYLFNTASLVNGQSITFTPNLASYAWTGPNGFTSAVQNPAIALATAAATGTYSVVLTDSVSGCQNTATTTSATVNSTSTAAPTITAGGPTSFCTGGSVVLTASAAAGYLWSTGATTQSVTVTSAGNYTVQATGSGCPSVPSAPTLITVNALPATPTITPGGTASLCSGSSTTLTASAASAYLWSNGATTQSITVTSAGSYTVSVTNANGCQSAAASSPTVVTAFTSPASPVAGSNAPTCIGSALNLTASTVQLGGYTMNSNSGISFVDISTTGTSIGTISDDSETNISLPSFNFNGITYTTARIGTNGAIAFGSTAGDIAATNVALPTTANAAGNIFLAPYWDDLNTVTGPGTIKTQTVGNVFIIQYTALNQFDFPSGTITFQVQLNLVTGAIHFVYQDVITGSATYDKGITATVGIQMSSTSAIQYSLNTASLSNGQSITFTPNAANYSWTGPNGFTSSVQNPTIPSATSGANGVYSVVAVNSTTGCQSAPATTTVALNPALNVTPIITASGPTTFCAGGSVVLTASGGSSYLWSTGATTQSITVNVTGSYTVQALSAFGCPSLSSAPTTVTVNPAPTTPTITASGSTTICSGTSVTLTSSAATNYLWSTGETTQSITVNATDSYAVQVSDALGCLSASSAATIVTVITAPVAPTATATQSFCNSAKVSNLTATGTALKWYNVATGGTALLTTASIVTGTYYVSQTVNGCESPRKAVTVVIYVTPPPVASNQTFCTSALVSDLVATGTNINWYLFSGGGFYLSPTTKLANGDVVYATQTLNGCESTDTQVVVTINTTAVPTALQYQIYTGSATLANLSATGTGINWYATATGGTALPSNTALGDGVTYYASQTISSCESTSRVAVTVKRISDPVQNFCGSATVSNLVAAPLAGQVANWFSSASSTVVLPGINALTTKTYYVEESYLRLVSTLAGGVTYGYNNGTGPSAQFSGINGMAADANGNVFVSDTDYNTIRKITPAGVVSLIAGNPNFASGSTDGTGSAARFYNPYGMVFDKAGNLYIADTNNHRIRKITPAGVVSTLAGGVAGYQDSSGSTAKFNQPTGIAIDSNGNLFVTDYGNNMIRKVTSFGSVTTFAGSTTSGNVNATGTNARFANPYCIAIDKSDNLYIGENYSTIRKITPAGVVTNFAGGATGTAPIDGIGAAASFNSIRGITCDETGSLFVLDYGYGGVNLIRKVTPAAEVTTFAGGASGYVDGLYNNAQFETPTCIAADTFGNVFVGENTRVRALKKETFSNRVQVNVTINDPNGAAPTTTAQTFCNTGYVSDLVATGVGTTNWYDVATGGTPLASTTALSTGTYYASQSLNGCESSRTPAAITVNLTPAPNGLTNQIYAGSGTLANLAVTGTNIKWYTTATGGSVLPNTTVLADNTTYFATQTLNACESSSRLAVSVKRISNTSQSFCGTTIVTNLVTTPTSGQTVSWYSSATGGTPLTTESVTTGIYYVEQGPTTSNRVAVAITVNPLPPTPTITASGPTTFCSGNNVVLTSSPGQSYYWSSGVINARNNPVYSSGSYTVRVGDANGCLSPESNPVVVTVNPLPQTPIVSSNAPVCQGDTLNLTATNVGLSRFLMNGNSGIPFIDISNSGTSIGPISDDSMTNITMPPFMFNGVVYTAARISTNGVIVFGDSQVVVSAANTTLFGDVQGASETFLAPYWTDLNVTNTSEPASIKTQTVGDYFIIQYTMHNHYQFYGGTITFQVQLSLSSGIIHYVYQDVVFGSAAFDNGITATVGLKMNSNNQVQYSYNTASLVNGQSITFLPVLPTYEWTVPNGAINNAQNPTLPAASATDSGRYFLRVVDPYSSCRSAITGIDALVKVTDPPVVATVQSFCPFVTVADLVASGQGTINWYDVATGGTPLTSVTPLSTGTYYVTQYLNGCESLRVPVQVTINPITTSTINVSACGSYTWAVNNQTYTQTGTYTVTGANIYGCLDTKTLVLTINSVTATTQTVTACGSYTWLAGNGATYTQSGTYTYVNGCQTQTLQLTISSGTTNTTTISSCDSYYWSVTGQTYTVSGTYTYVNGCNTQILVLTINSRTTVTTDITVCNAYTWPVNGQTYTASGTYTYEVGCRTEILNLTLACALVVNAKVYIEGYYDVDAHAMRPVLANRGIGNSTTAVDIVTLELWNGNGELVDATTAMLQTDGTVTATFTTAPYGSYYIGIKYRNAIETWSAAPQLLNGTPLSYDFTTTAIKAFGDNMVRLESGIYGIYSGDIYQDNFIDLLDYSLWETDYNESQIGDFNTDLNGDGFVDLLDYSIWENNYNNSIYSNMPTF